MILIHTPGKPAIYYAVEVAKQKRVNPGKYMYFLVRTNDNVTVSSGMNFENRTDAIMTAKERALQDALDYSDPPTGEIDPIDVSQGGDGNVY